MEIGILKDEWNCHFCWENEMKSEWFEASKNEKLFTCAFFASKCSIHMQKVALSSTESVFLSSFVILLLWLCSLM